MPAKPLATPLNCAKLRAMWKLWSRWQKAASLAFLVAALGLATVLPMGLHAIQQSPDETAVLVAAQRIIQTGSAAMPADANAAYPWLHPRSWTRQGDTLMPVGFLGWPTMLAPFAAVIPAQGLALVATLLILSGLFPLGRLLEKRFGFWPTYATLVALVTYPVVTLYLNRSLFPNLILLTGLAWSCWLLEKGREKYILSGILFGLTIAIRPLELIWLLPAILVFGAYIQAWNKKQILIWFVSVLVGCLPATLIAWNTYGSLFQLGYWLRDWGVEVAVSAPAAQAAPVAFSWSSILPYGFHPRHVLWNMRAFWLEWLWPWFALGLVGIITTWNQIPKNKKTWLSALVLGVSAVAILVVYGSGLYLDHVQTGAVTLGNSFLRYTFPLELIPILLIAPCLAALKAGWMKKTGYALVALISVLGLVMTFTSEDERLLSIRTESQRYEEIRATAVTHFSSQDIILSDRSDKIFFPVFQAASPLPGWSEVKKLVTSQPHKVGLFMRPPDEVTKKQLQEAGIVLTEVASFGRESLYTVN